jgi:circadian clock protein KaiC
LAEFEQEIMAEAIERVHTGIPGLDHVLEGGFPKGARVLLAGGAGCGKTICCGQYLYKGATRYGEAGVYVSTEEPPSEFMANMLRFGWDFKKLQTEKKIGMVDAVYQRTESESAEQESLQSILYNLRSKLSEVKILVEQLGATRLVVDSLPGFGFRVTDLNTLREIFLEVGLLLKDVGCTTMMTTEIVEGSGLISRYGIEEFLATGVMVLALVRQSSPIRKLYVRKMRGTSHSLNDFAFTIGHEGVELKGPIGVRSVRRQRRLHSPRRKRRSRL